MLNNPLTYNDPSGEFIHLIIGAVIGGVINWAINGAEFTWKGLGHFVVGAVAGALSAGIGAGVSSAMAGGSFSAGFMGTQAAKIAASSFVTGATVGASAGFSAGFTTGLGNGLLNGQNFGQAIGSGIRDGIIGGISGGVIGGLASGIHAAIDERRFWDGATVVDTTILDQANPYVAQTGEANCVAACGESATNSRISQQQIRNNVLPNSNVNTAGLGDGNVLNYISKTEGRTYQCMGSNLSKNQLVSQMQRGKVRAKSYFLMDITQ